MPMMPITAAPSRLPARLRPRGNPVSSPTNIEVEAHALLLRRLGRSLAREWPLSGGLPVLRASPREEQLGKELAMMVERVP
jgi:hypothetical protein